MANPVMNQVGEQMRRTPAGYPEMPGYQVGGNAQPANPTYPQSATPGGYSQTTFDQGEQIGQPQRVTRPMPLDDVLVRTGASFGVMVGSKCLSGECGHYAHYFFSFRFGGFRAGVGLFLPP